jgi:hypothetical protein
LIALLAFGFQLTAGGYRLCYLTNPTTPKALARSLLRHIGYALRNKGFIRDWHRKERRDVCVPVR